MNGRLLYGTGNRSVVTNGKVIWYLMFNINCEIVKVEAKLAMGRFTNTAGLLKFCLWAQK